MTIEFECNSCKSRLRAKPKLAGKTIACPKCNTQLVVPQIDVSEEVEKGGGAEKLLLATAKQKAYATELGIKFPESVDRKTMSKMIDEALEKRAEERYDRLDALQREESKIRDQLRDEIMAECDEDDPRMSVASTEQILEGLAQRDIGAILITFEYGILSGIDDLKGETFALNSTDDIDEKDIKTIISWLGISMMRR
jgi:hypothetical protein